MAYVFKYTSEDIRKEAGDKHCGLHQGYTSQILPVKISPYRASYKDFVISQIRSLHM